MRRSPPLLGSLGAHAAAGLLLLVLAPAPPPPIRTPMSVQMVQDVAVEREAEPDRALFPDLPEEEALPLPEAEEPATDELRAFLEPPPPADLPEATRGGEIPDGAIALAGPRKREPEKAVKFDGNPDFNADGSGDANRTAAGLVLEGIGGKGSGDRALLRKLDPRRVLVVKGSYDRVEDTLALLGIRHDTLKPEEVAVAPLPPEAILIIDCDADPLSKEACKAIRAFVHSGGYLCTTDWGLENVLEKSFPGVLRSLARGGMGVSTRNEVVGMRITSPGHVLVRGIRGVSEDAAWWVEDQAHPVEVVARDRVTVLAESPEFKKRYRSGVLAATFTFGKGRVLHLLGHAWQKEGNLKGTYAIQRMILNLLIDRAATLE